MRDTTKGSDLERQREELIQVYGSMADDDYAKLIDMAFNLELGVPSHQPHMVVSGDSSAKFEPNPKRDSKG